MDFLEKRQQIKNRLLNLNKQDIKEYTLRQILEDSNLFFEYINTDIGKENFSDLEEYNLENKNDIEILRNNILEDNKDNNSLDTKLKNLL